MAYNKNVNQVDNLVLSKTLRTMENNHSSFVGTMTSLKAKINRICSKGQRTALPKSPAALRVVVNRIANRLRSRGVSLFFRRTAQARLASFLK